jgi:glycosyl transferase family 1
MTIIFSGSIGRFPVGGHAWINMQYLIGLRELGHEVFYLEDCGEESWVYNWETQELTTDLAYPTAYVRACLQSAGLPERWIYRAGEQSVGMALDDFLEVCREASLFLVHSVPVAMWRPEYMWPRRRAFVDTDPGFLQMSLDKGNPLLKQTIDRCHALFTVGQRIGAKDCPIPTGGRLWHKTLPPVALSHWPLIEDGPANEFTCVIQWRGYKDEVYQGVTYGQKDREFPRFIDLPRLTAQPLRIALTGAPEEKLTPHGWHVEPGWCVSRTPSSYREFIGKSRAEFSVAKHGYVKTQGGWFSDRSVCYLACGRPVLVQDTGLGDWLPLGEGVVTFRSVAEAVEGIAAINADYETQRAGARRIAEQVFATGQVLPEMLTHAAD